MGFELRKATKKDVPLKLALMGPSGSGKTYTSLRIASELGKRIAFIDTEDRSSELYADEFNFDVGQLHDYTPQSFVAAAPLPGTPVASNGWSMPSLFRMGNPMPSLFRMGNPPPPVQRAPIQAPPRNFAPPVVYAQSQPNTMMPPAQAIPITKKRRHR